MLSPGSTAIPMRAWSVRTIARSSGASMRLPKGFQAIDMTIKLAPEGATFSVIRSDVYVRSSTSSAFISPVARGPWHLLLLSRHGGRACRHGIQNGRCISHDMYVADEKHARQCAFVSIDI